jgi:hypothetical protein
MTSMMLRLAACLLAVLVSISAQAQHSADPTLAGLDAQSRLEGQEFALRARALNERIQRGWAAASVRQIMGAPERVQRSTDGADRIEVWGYQGFDVRVQFRNDLVETWFVRFAQ